MDNMKYHVLKPGDLPRSETEHRDFQLDVLNGLSDTPKHLSSRYFYDDQGSTLFQKIMALPEYYLTQCEFDILKEHRPKISRHLAGTPFNMIELGAGDGYKTSLLIEQFLKDDIDFQYWPLDISEGAMKILVSSMTGKFPDLQLSGIVAEYFEGIKWISSHSDRRNVVLFLGSNIGNFSAAQTRVFLRSLWNSLNDGDIVIIGFDYKKDIDVMLHAYNDATGVTAAFNLNLLRRINREMGGNFDIDRFRFYATYSVFSGAMESYLVSLENQEVFIEQLGETFSFKAWEPIHTEYSYKYLHSDIVQLAERTGYHQIAEFSDQRGYFVDVIWEVEKKRR